MRRVAVGMVAVAGLALAGCGGSSGGHHVAAASGGSTTSATLAPSTTSGSATGTSGSSGTSGSAGTGSTRSTATTGGSSTSTAAGNGSTSCQHLTVTSGGGQGGAGHIGTVLLFRNSGSTTCQVSGYPGVDGVLAGGKRIAARRTPSGYLGGIQSSSAPTVSLAPGATASALVEGTDVPEGNATTCASFTGLLVTPPNTTATVQVTGGGQNCSGLQVHPVVSGTSGGA